MYTLVKRLAALAVSLCAFAALGAGLVLTARATAPAPVALTPEPDRAPAPPAIAPPAAIAPPTPEPVAPPAIAEAEAPAPPAGVEVPELTGRTGLRAFRRLRELGLVAELRDEDGEPVPVSQRRWVSVIAQAVPPGGRVEAGGTVRLDVRYPPAAFASGY